MQSPRRVVKACSIEKAATFYKASMRFPWSADKQSLKDISLTKTMLASENLLTHRADTWNVTAIWLPSRKQSSAAMT